MKNRKKQTRKELNGKLVAAATVYLTGLKKQRQKKLIQYLESKMGDVANYYMSLLKKKTAKDMLFAVSESELQINKLPGDDKAEMATNSETLN